MTENSLWKVLRSLIKDSLRLWSEMEKDSNVVDKNLADMVSNLESALATAKELQRKRRS